MSIWPSQITLTHTLWGCSAKLTRVLFEPYLLLSTGGYEFLMENCRLRHNRPSHGLIVSPDRTNDKICIFGFSRGAYTARALAGMIHKVDSIDKRSSDFAQTFPQVGLLPAGNSQQVPFAYRMYTRDDKDGRMQSQQFKEAFSMDIRVEFLGVWYRFFLCFSGHLTNEDAPCRDTVCSVGFIPRQLPFTASNTTVRFFRHALALDERRATFLVNPWHRRNKEDLHNDELPKTDVREVWFAGCHAGFVLPLFVYRRITLTLCVRRRRRRVSPK
jgi:uncharacterized protein (DUF2235 family)